MSLLLRIHCQELPRTTGRNIVLRVAGCSVLARRNRDEAVAGRRLPVAGCRFLTKRLYDVIVRELPKSGKRSNHRFRFNDDRPGRQPTKSNNRTRWLAAHQPAADRPPEQGKRQAASAPCTVADCGASSQRPRKESKGSERNDTTSYRATKCRCCC